MPKSLYDNNNNNKIVLYGPTNYELRHIIKYSKQQVPLINLPVSHNACFSKHTKYSKYMINFNIYTILMKFNSFI